MRYPVVELANFAGSQNALSSDRKHVRSERVDPLIPPLWELAILFILPVVYIGGDALFGQSSTSLLNFAGPVALAITLSVGALHMTRIDASAIWTALFWFRVATALFFGIGQILLKFVSMETLIYMNTFFSPFPGQIMTLNIIIAYSSFIVLASARVASIYVVRVALQAKFTDNGRSLFAAGATFAMAGAAINYLVLLPHEFSGSVDAAPLPGLVMSLSLLAPVGLYMLTLWCLRYRKGLLPFTIAFLGLQILGGLIEFNKSSVILSTMMFFMAFLESKASLFRVTVTVVSILFIFSVIVPIAAFGRNTLSERYKSIQSGSLEERLDILQNHYSSSVVSTAGSDIEASLVRICYANVAAFAVAQYEGGLPGSSLDNIFSVLVPRVLWPNKPIISDIGVDYNVRATGNSHSSSGPGLMAEGYWDFGWLGIPILMVPLGIFLLFISRYAIWILDTGRWWYFPLVLYAMRIGMRVDGFFVLDVVGPIAVMLVAHCIFNLLERFLSARADQHMPRLK